jgi:hypothetical protein
LTEYNASINKAISEQGKLKQEKLKYSLIRQANEEILQKLYDARTRALQLLSAPQLEQIETDSKAHGEKLQEVHYQNTKNELLSKGQKTTMEFLKLML